LKIKISCDTEFQYTLRLGDNLGDQLYGFHYKKNDALKTHVDDLCY